MAIIDAYVFTGVMLSYMHRLSDKDKYYSIGIMSLELTGHECTVSTVVYLCTGFM